MYTYSRVEIYMICSNCGAVIKDHELVCPYCGFENEKEAKKIQEDYIKDINEKKKELDKEPEIKVYKI